MLSFMPSPDRGEDPAGASGIGARSLSPAEQHAKPHQAEDKRSMARYTVLLTPDFEGGGDTVTVPVLPGCVSDGQTVEAAMERAQEAIEPYLRGEDEVFLAFATNRVEVIVASVDVSLPT